MLLQANDFLRLEQDHGCQLQIGGSDQSGNMLGGIDLIRRVARPPGLGPGLAAAHRRRRHQARQDHRRPHLARPGPTSPYQFFQHWMGTDDRQVRAVPAPVHPPARWPRSTSSWRPTRPSPGRRLAQRRLAQEATALVHGAGRGRTPPRRRPRSCSAPTPPRPPRRSSRRWAGRCPPSPLDRVELAAGIDLADVLAAPGSWWRPRARPGGPSPRAAST